MKNVKRKFRLLVSLALLWSAYALAQQQPQPGQTSGSQDAPAGTLRIKTDVTGVLALLDNKEMGRTPLTLTSVTAGTHRLILLKEGYEDHLQPVEVSAQKTASIFVVMKPLTIPMPPLPAEFKVIHQHRLGSCVGVLTVTADALDYKAEKDEDKFQIPIRSLQSVSRSWGSVPGMAPAGVNAATDMMAFRIEAPGRSYGFLAYKDSVDDKMTIASERTRELFETVYRLWMISLKPANK